MLPQLLVGASSRCTLSAVNVSETILELSRVEAHVALALT